VNRRNIDILVVAAIWALVFGGAFLLAPYAADDDPSTDDAAGAGALAAVVSGLLTALYLGLRHTSGRLFAHRLRTMSRAKRIDVAGTLAVFVVGVVVSEALGLGDLAFLLAPSLAAAFLFVRLGRSLR
jgi:hypothetical protein